MGRSPQGERGLKCFCGRARNFAKRSLPARGARIEIRGNRMLASDAFVAPRKGSAD